MTIQIDRDYLTATLVDLVRINSINPSLVADGKGETEIANYIAQAMEAIGLEVHLYDVQPNRPNVVSILRGQGNGKSLMLNAHTDTVGVEGMAEPFSGAIRDGKLYGRGAYDMKASIAASLAVAKAFVASNTKLAGDLVLAMVADEEYASIGTEDIIQRFPTDGAIVTEPSALRIGIAHRGWYWIEVETMGRAAHGSRYMDGIDANRLMGYFLVEVDKYADELLQREPHPLLGTPSVHVQLLKGGSSPAVYAASCKAELERRILPDETAASVTAEIQAIVDRLTATVPNFKAIVRRGFGRDAFETPQDSAIVQTVVQAAKTVTGNEPEIYGELWWMDSGLLGNAGIETVIIGPTGGGAHADEEWVDLDSVYALAQILAEASIAYTSQTKP